ncbi:hypothetical protein [Stigmatella erecta]|uniref:Outer membrane protein beta-barrel domain-containing protein n=1 Tax=Stigmatella erecta TaxID=83460 RepID=A0A1I0JS04_9BACT|nr:hypothetical protein [Stigmatella erecta]SEU13500.1 hypothetical protein SAMN05443639_10851 [Stigmatella erecta]
MRTALLTSLLALSVGLPAWGQEASGPASANPEPDESWLSFPGPEAGPPPVDTMPVPPPPPRREAPGPAAPRQEVSRPGARAPVRPAAFGSNRVSLQGAIPLGQGQLAAGVLLGFPLVSGQVSWGALSWLDAGAVVNSLYGVMNEVNARVRLSLVNGEEAQVSLGLEGGHAFFLKPQAREQHGGRYFTGRRDWNLLPGLTGSARVGRRTRAFLDVRYHLAFDTDPVVRTPLGGAPASVKVSSNVLFRTGVEVPFSERTSYVIMVGGNIHGRPEDASFMPAVSVGMVAGI